MSIENISWLFVALSLLGNYYVIQKNVMGQWLWAVANIGWIGFDLYFGLYSQAFLFCVYFCMCVWGIIAWSKPEAATAAD